MKFSKIGCIASSSYKSHTILEDLVNKYSFVDIKELEDLSDLDLIIVIGGDGFMLHTLHRYMHLNIPFFGLNSGTVGFLMNRFNEENFLERIENTKQTIVNPLKMIVTDIYDNVKSALAINEVSLFRKSTQAAKLRIIVDKKVRMKLLVSDGIILSTSAGSTAYNLSVGGPIIPIDSKLLALTPISPFRPRRWHGALLPYDTVVEFEVLQSNKRPVNAVADYIEVRNAKLVNISRESSLEIKLLFDNYNSLEERVIREQFAY